MFEMDINKTDMFEKFFNGFQEKFIESFKAANEEKTHVQLLENHKASKESYRTYFNCAWEFLEKTTIAHQQAKVEELEGKLKQAYEDVDTFATAHEALEKHVDRDRSLIQFTQKANKDLIAERDELQKRVDKALQEIKGAAQWINEYAIDDPDFIKGGALTALRRLEQALKGEG